MESEEINRKLERLMNKLEKLSTDINKKFDENSGVLNKILEKQEKLANENKLLREENIRKSKEIVSLTARVNFLEQRTLDTTLSISGIPRRDNENLVGVVKSIGENIGVAISSYNMVKLYRRKNKRSGAPGDIILTCNTQMVKEKLIEEVKKKKLMLADIGFKGEKRRFYINQELTLEKKELLYKALSLKEENNWKYVWQNKGQVLIRRVEGGEVVRVETCDHLKSICSLSKSSSEEED